MNEKRSDISDQEILKQIEKRDAENAAFKKLLQRLNEAKGKSNELTEKGKSATKNK